MPTYELNIVANGQDNASPMLIGLGGNISGLGMTAATALGSLAADAFKAAGSAAIDFGATALKAAGEYEQNLNVFQSVTGATGDQMELLRQKAKDLGADMDLPGTSAAGAAAAMLELGKAGLDVDNVLKAAKGTLQLSAAGVGDNARAAEIAANALMAFHLEGDKATLVADQLAAVANKSSVEVTDVADSFKMAASVFSAFQGSVVGNEQAMTQLNAAIGILGNVGIKGSDAGTSLKQMLLQLTGPSSVAKDQMKALMYAAQGAGDMFGKGSDGVAELTKALQGNATERGEALKSLATINPAAKDLGDIAYDASGKMRPFPEIIDLVTKATKSMSDEQRNAAITSIFGADASRAVIALMQAGPAAFADMTAAITQQGAAGAAAAAQNKGLLGALDGLQSVWETLQLAMAEPLLEPLAAGIRSVGDGISAAQPILVGFVEAYLVPAVQGLANFLAEFVAAPDKIAFLKGAIADGFSFVQGYITNNLPGWKQTLALWAGAAVDWIVEISPVALDRVGGYVVGLIDKAGQALPGVIETFGRYAAAFLNWIAGAAPDAIRETGGFVGSILDALGRATPSVVEALGRVGAKFVSWIGETIPKLEPEITKLVGQAGQWLKDRAPIIGEKVGSWVGEFLSWTGKANNDLSPKILSLVTSAGVEIGKYAPDIGKALILGFKQGIDQEWNGAGNGVLNVLTGGLWSIITSFWGIHSPSTKMADIGKFLLDGLWNGIGQWGDMAGRIYTWFDQNVVWKMRGLLNQFPDIGQNIISGLWQGIQNRWGQFQTDLQNAAMSLPEAIRNAFGIHSPSTVFADIGQWLFPGMVVGAERSLPGVQQDLGQLANTLPQAALPSLALPASAALGSGSATGGTTTIIINNTIQGSVTTERDLARTLRDLLKEDARLNGRPVFA